MLVSELKKSKFHVRLKIASPAAHFKASCIHGAWISTKSLTLVELKQEYCGLLVAKYYGCWCSGSLHQQVVGNHMYDHGPFSTSIKDFFKHALRYQFENCCIHSAGGIKCRAVRNLYVYFAQLFLYKYHRQSLPNIFSGFFTMNEAIHNHYTRQIEHFHTHLAKSSQTARTLRCTGVKINNYFMNRLNYNCSDGVYKQKLKEHILMNDISHLYGGTR